MSIYFSKLERFSYINFTFFVLSFWIFSVTKILTFTGILKFSNTLSNVEFFSFFVMIGSLSIFLSNLFKLRDRKEMELIQMSQELSLKLKAINETNAVIEFSTDSIILSVNRKFTDIFGYNECIIGKPHSVLVPDFISTSPSYKIFWDNLRNGNHKFDEFHRKDKEGNDVFITGTYVPLKNKSGDVYKILKIAQDNTETIKMIQEIETKNTYLEHAAKIIRHDMHSGINTYIPRGLKSLLRRVSAEQIKKCNAESPIKMISEGLAHTQRVYKGVYEFTNLVKPNSKLSVDIHNISEILKEFLRPLHYRDMIKIGALPTINVNKWLFCTGVDNLIRNGLKYNDSKSKLIKIYAENDCIVIQDNGRGMSSSQFEEYSKPYVRSTKNKEAGSGLGLNICITIMKEHGFSIYSKLITDRNKIGTKIYIKYK